MMSNDTTAPTETDNLLHCKCGATGTWETFESRTRCKDCVRRAVMRVRLRRMGVDRLKVNVTRYQELADEYQAELDRREENR